MIKLEKKKGEENLRDLWETTKRTKIHSMRVLKEPREHNGRNNGGACLAQSVGHGTLNLGVVSSGPMLGVEIP